MACTPLDYWGITQSYTIHADLPAGLAGLSGAATP
jgi:hypothetical protein